MTEHLQKIAALMAENQAETVRTPQLEVALGALQTAFANTMSHIALVSAPATEG
jgi:hypothetical protein